MRPTRVLPGVILFSVLAAIVCAESLGLPAAGDDLGESMRLGDEAAASLQALKARESQSLKRIKSQRAEEVAKLKAQHKIEEAAERQQQQLEMKVLRRQQHTELQHLKEKMKIKLRVTARVLGEKPGDVMKTPELVALQQRQRKEADTIANQRKDELQEMVATHAQEVKRQIAQGLRDVAFAKRKYTDEVAHRQEQLEFYRFQESKARANQDGTAGGDLGEGVDLMSESALRHKVLWLEAQNKKLTEKNELLLDASTESRSTEKMKAQIQSLNKQKAEEDKEVEILKEKLKVSQKVWTHNKQEGPQMLDSEVSNAEAVLAVP